jgi:hypothetical protein
MRKMDEKSKEIIRAINRLADTEDGKTFINYLKCICGFDVSDVVMDGLDISIQATLNNSYRRSVYVDIRRLIQPELLKDIEFRKDEKQNDNDDDD